MTEPIHLTKSQQRKFYRKAVEQTLVSLYSQPESKSRALVLAWWKRISDTAEFKSDIFFHAEPLHTAADIAHIQSLAITADNEHVYQNVLALSRDHALSRKRLTKAKTYVLPDAPVASDFQTRLQPVAAKRIEQRKLLARG